jgi:hypothetical protein
LAVTVKKIVYTLLVFGLAWCADVCANASQQIPVAPVGKTSVIATSAKVRIEVIVTTHEVSIEEADRDNADIAIASCTYSRFPCSVVDNLSITVKGKKIVVPHSVFLDLADINTAEIRITKNKYSVRLEGGDASESYIAVIEFDDKRVKAKRVYSGEANALLQKTVYYWVEMQ